VAEGCADYIRDLNDFLDGELDPSLCEAIEEHIGTCRNCKLMIDSLKMTVRLCRESGECEELPGELSDRLTGLLRQRWEKKFGKRG
jgi:anti-sigma factor (TIGR02949 family)